MKYLSVMLTLIVLILGFIVYKINIFESKIQDNKQDFEVIVASNQALINTNQKLQATIEELNKQIVEIVKNFKR